MNWMWMDMNSYFASVEQYLRPELRDRPVAVVPIETDSTSVIAASYDAKRKGVRVGTPVWEAKRLCPGIRLIKARPDIYVKIHHRILDSVGRCTPIHRIYSIDEWAIPLKGNDRKPDQAKLLAEQIKFEMRQEFGECLTSSIGIATSRLLAKIAAGLIKPDGLTILPVSDMPDRLENEKLESLCGIGDGMLLRLQAHGIWSIRDLWNLNREQATRIWGSVTGARWWAGFHGIDEPELPVRRRSMTHANVLEPRFRNQAGARGILVRLVCKLGQRLRRAGYYANSLHIELKEADGNYFSQQIGLPCTNDTTTLLQQFGRVWNRWIANGCPIKKVSVTVSDLVLSSQVAPSLFGEMEKLQRLSHTIDRINERWGSAAVYFGTVHEFRHQMDNKIAFGRVPDDCI
jgi:DNA polymerase IV